jgi:copper(I)-binding protein
MKRLVAGGVLSVLAACGAGAGTADVATISVDGAWARASAPGQTLGAVYFEIEAEDDDTLMSLSVPDSVAAGVEIHETVVDEASVTSSATSGMEQMTMRRLDGGLELPAGETVSIRPGGHHVMLVDLTGPLLEGQSFDMTLEFERADPLTVAVAVAETEP